MIDALLARLEQEGLEANAAAHVADELARNPTVLLKTMVEKELGLVIEEGRIIERMRRQ